jgi:hypothetical protein
VALCALRPTKSPMPADDFGGFFLSENMLLRPKSTR